MKCQELKSPLTLRCGCATTTNAGGEAHQNHAIATFRQFFTFNTYLSDVMRHFKSNTILVIVCTQILRSQKGKTANICKVLTQEYNALTENLIFQPFPWLCGVHNAASSLAYLPFKVDFSIRFKFATTYTCVCRLFFRHYGQCKCRNWRIQMAALFRIESEKKY